LLVFLDVFELNIQGSNSISPNYWI